jgi:hypothetical protein
MNNALHKTKYIFFNALPVLVMVLLIPFVQNDFLLTGIYMCIIAVSFWIKYEPKDWVFFIFGFCIMIASELLFISTGVETFVRNSLFGIMPLWLPFLWAYGFVAIHRATHILES